jgi:hypothetical protein
MNPLLNASETSVAETNARVVAPGSASRTFDLRGLLLRLTPGFLGAVLYLLNNLDVLHGLIAPPAGYVPMGIQRNSDIAIYLTWLHGYAKGWLLPNYNAPWITPSDFVNPGLVPVSLLQRALGVSPVVGLQMFSFLGYVFVAYALAFAYKSFCKTRQQALWALLVAAACVPFDSLPLISHLLGGSAQYGAATGRVHFLTLADGFFRGLVTWPFITYGTGFQILSMGLLARYAKSGEQRWMNRLIVTCLLSTLLHPFEIFVTSTTAAVVLLRQSGFTRKNLTNLALIALAAGVGMSPYAIQTLRSPWMHEVANANSITLAPAMLLGIVGLPSVLVVALFFFGLPGNRSDETLVVKTWFWASFLMFFVPGLPFSLHFLDGAFIPIGLLLVMQLEELLERRPQVVRPLLQFAGVPLLVWSLLPHGIYRAQAWDAGVETMNLQFAFDTCTTFYGACLRPAAVAPAAEAATVRWLRANASSDDLVLATEDASPWVAEAPVHSFASHWLFSLLWPYPNYRNVRNAFFSGSLSAGQAHQLLAIIGARFVIVPDGSAAGRYLDIGVQRARLDTWTIYEVPGARMKPYHDAGILALGR